jgi:hypothetical protein
MFVERTRYGGDVNGEEWVQHVGNCSCMKQCCQRSHNALFSLCVQMLKDQMRELADSAESTMQELESMKTRAYSMTAQQQRCEYCSDLLLGKAFYLFPCSHGFHCHCLVQRCTQHLSPAQVRLQCTDSNSGNNVARCTILLQVCTLCVWLCCHSGNCFCAHLDANVWRC